MRPWRRLRPRTRGQAMVEFLLVLPLALVVLFTIIELARLFHAWLAIENGARFGVRYAVTGAYDPGHCAGFPGGVCDDPSEEDAARLLSIKDAAMAGAAGILRDPAVLGDGVPGFFKVTVCSNKSGVVFNPSDPDNHVPAQCSPQEDPGGPGDRVIVAVDFDHPLLAPILTGWWPMLHLTSTREAIVEQFRTSRVVALPATIALPTFTPTNSPTPTVTSTPTATLPPTPTLTNTPTPCKVPPEVDIVAPPDGAVYGPGDDIPGQAVAWDPDNVNPDTCDSNPPGADGTGITRVQFRYEWWDGSRWVLMYSRNESQVAYCGFGGNGPCNTRAVSSMTWPNGNVIQSGLHRLRARARDDEYVYGGWEEVRFTINALPTPTPSCSGVTFGSFQFQSSARIRQYINNTTYFGLKVVRITIDWGPLNVASDLYGWNEYVDWVRWNGSTVYGGNDYTSTTSFSLNRDVAVGTNANYIQVDWDGGFEGRLNSPPLNLTSANFGFTIEFSDPACNLSRAAASATFPTITPTNTPQPPTNTPTPTNTLPPSSTPTRTPSPTITNTPPPWTPTNTPQPPTDTPPPPTDTPTPPGSSPTPTVTPTPTDTPEFG